MTDAKDDWTTDAAAAYGARLLRGERVLLRATEPEDEQQLADWWRQGELAVLQGSQFVPAPTEAVGEFIRKLGRNGSESGTVGFAVTTHDGQLIGHSSLRHLSLPERIATFGIVLAPGFLGQGYGTDTTRVMLHFAFSELGAHKVELRTHAFNTRAIAAYEKAGFVVEGRRRASVFKDGRFFDEMCMGVLEEDWRAAHSDG